MRISDRTLEKELPLALRSFSVSALTPWVGCRYEFLTSFPVILFPTVLYGGVLI